MAHSAQEFAVLTEAAPTHLPLRFLIAPNEPSEAEHAHRDRDSASGHAPDWALRLLNELGLSQIRLSAGFCSARTRDDALRNALLGRALDDPAGAGTLYFARD